MQPAGEHFAPFDDFSVLLVGLFLNLPSTPLIFAADILVDFTRHRSCHQLKFLKMKTHLPLHQVALLAGFIVLLSAAVLFLLQTVVSLAKAFGNAVPVFHPY